MAKVILKPLAPPDSPIYNQLLSIGARLTKPSLNHQLDGVNLQKCNSVTDAYKNVTSRITIKK